MINWVIGQGSTWGWIMLKRGTAEIIKKILIFRKNLFEYSSLGKMDPKDREEHLRKETIKDFFPRAVLNTKRGERVLISMLAGTDIILYGPPGSGKSQTAQDILDIAKQQKLGFIVEGCKANCNPFSLFDKEFAKVVAS